MKNFQNFIIILYPIVFTLGTCGNVLSFLVFSGKKFKHTIFETYFRMISLTDTLTLVLSVIDFLCYYKYEIDLFSVSEFSCKFISYVFYAIPACSVWLTVMISYDRMLSVLYSNKLKFREFLNSSR